MKKWWLLAVCGLLAACSQSSIEELNASINGDAPMFYASVEDADAESRTYLDETGKMRWTNDDRITIFFGDNYNREYAFTGKTGALSGGFKQISVDDEFMAGTKMTANYALYPHSSETMLDPSGYFECELPAVQNYAEGSFGLNANTMVSVTQSVDDRFLQFKNVSSYLKLNLYGDDVTVKQITLQGNNNEPLAGAAIITPTYGGEPTLTWAASGTTQVLTLDCGSGVKIGQTEEDATAFYLVVPPTTFEKGFAVTITDTEGKVCTKSTSNEQTFTRNVTKNMPAFAVKCEVPSNQIWYTSTDGNIVTPNKTDGFGVAIKSNTYTDGKGVITFEGDVTTIGKQAFYNCTSLASITLPESLTTIEQSAFVNCTSLASITLPEGVMTIGSYAFQACTSLASITLPEGVTTIGESAFYYCTSLASITIPESVTELGAGAFAGCSNLQHFEGKYASDNGRCLIKENVLIAFAPAGLTTYTVPEGVTTIGYRAFSGCESLASITLPEGVTTIGEWAFYGCTDLASITLPESVTTIGEDAFRYCESLASITLPEGVTTIEQGTFARCTSLASITLPEGVTTIGWHAFSYCTSLKSVYCKPTTPPTGGNNMFANNAEDRKIYVPAGSANAYKAAEHWSDYAADIVEEAEPTPAANQIWYTSTDGNIVKPSRTGAFGVAIQSNTYTDGKGVITFDGKVTEIGVSAFEGYDNLASIILPNSVTSIGSHAFHGCDNLVSVTIPEEVTTIGHYVFQGCENLMSLTIPESVKTIGNGAFVVCDKLAVVYCKPSTPPAGGEEMFSSSPISKIYVPASSDDSILNAYKTATGWSIYADLIAEEPVEALINNKILYTSTDGKIVSPYTYATDAFGDANIVSNTYENGQGVITFDAELTTIGERAFVECSTLKSVTIPDSVTSLGQYAFKYCTSLMSITLPNSISSIGMETFYNCTALKSITIPDSVTHIGYYAFQYCRALQNVVMGNSVKTIANYAFDWCEALTSVTIPDSVTSIGMGAFRNCTSLKDVYCFAVTPPTLGNEYVFYNNASGRKIYVQIVAYDTYKAASIWSGYSIIADYTPTECTSLTIEADDVPGYMTSTTIRYSAMTNGVSFNRYQVKDIPMTGEVTSSQFDMNTSLTESVEHTISFSYLGRSATTTITQGPSLAKSYTIDLNNQWRNSTAPNPDSALYDGVYESFSNYHSNRGNAEMRIEIIGYEEFSIYVRCDSEVADYLKIYLDSTFIMDTEGDVSSDTSFSGYTEVKFSGITPGPHKIRIVYDKDESDHEGTDRGYVFIPKNQ